MLYTKDREYKNGKMNEFGSPSAVMSGLTIFGKSKYSSDIDKLFSDLLDNINADKLTLQKELNTRKATPLQQNVLKTQLVKLVNQTKVTFTNNLNNITNDLSNVQLKMTRNIDKLNYVIQGLDGYIDNKGVAQIYTIDSATTVNEIGMVMNTYSPLINLLETNLETKGIVYSSPGFTGKTYNETQDYVLPGGSFVTNDADKRFFLVFGYQLTNNYTNFETSVIGELTDKSLVKSIKELLNTFYRKPAENEKKTMSDIFSKYKKETNKVYAPGNITTLIKEKRQTGLTIKLSATDNDIKRLKNLYLGQNSDPDKNTFNGKVIF